MAAQCSVLGHGCAGDNLKYCAHCSALKDDQHIPYELMRREERVNFQILADRNDMFPRALLARNAGIEGRDSATEHGPRASTATFREAVQQEEDSKDSGEADLSVVAEAAPGTLAVRDSE